MPQTCTYNKRLFGPMFPDVEIPFDKTLIINSLELVNTFINEAFYGTQVPGRDFKVIIRQTGAYTVRGGEGWVNYLKNPSENPYKLEEKLLKSNILTSLTAPPGVAQNSDGRINLGSVGGNPCELGYYGYVGEIWQIKTPVYKVCYFDRSQRIRGIIPNGIVDVDEVFAIESVDNQYSYYEEIRNQSPTPIIITDDISIASGKGISIVQDLVNCAPVFNATDYDFGEVNYEKMEETGMVSIKNESKFDFTITSITPVKNPNFSIGNFITTVANDPFSNRSPLSVPFELKAGETREFEIKYRPLGEFGITHEMDIKYLVKMNSGTEVKEEKLTSKIQARPYKLSVDCDDVDWGIVDIKNVPGENVRELTIRNTGTKDVYLFEYKFVGIDISTFKNISIPDVSSNTPLLIEAGKTKSFKIEYFPNNVYGVLHTVKIDFKFVYQNPITGFFDQKVNKQKLTSVLKARAFKQNLDILLDEELIDLIFIDDNGVYTFKTLSKIRNKSAPIVKWKTQGLWGCVGERLDTYYTSSDSKSNNQYYLSVYSEDVNSPEVNHQFDISFGHISGSGTKYLLNNSNMKPSQVMYKKYLLECYPPSATSGSITRSEKKFKFKNGINGDYVYFIQTHRDQFKQMLDPGNFQLALSPLSSSVDQTVNTGSNVQIDQTSTTIYTLIDESYDTRQEQTDDKNVTDWYYITSGSLQHGVYGEESDNAWGVVFPKMGLIVLDGVVLDQSCSFNTVTASIDGQNTHKLFLSLSGSSSTTAARNYSSSFYARSSEKIVRETYFCELEQSEFNYSSNPTYFSGSANYFKYEDFIPEPNTYITSIGLYNSMGDLLAIGKLKNPILKNRKKSYVFQVSLILN